VEVRSNVSEDRIDERVLINYSLYAEATMEFQSFAEADLIGSERGEGYAEHAALLAESTNPIDRSLSVPELATFPAAYVTDGCLMRRKWTPMTMYSSQAPPTVPGRDLFNSQSNAMLKRISRQQQKLGRKTDTWTSWLMSLVGNHFRSSSKRYNRVAVL